MSAARDDSSDFTNIGQMVASAGYTLETHSNVHTSDGYQLTLHRIPHPKNANFAVEAPRPPLLLLHGMLGCAGHFLLQDERSLPYALSEAGFDVWMGNVRGVSCSRRHKTYDHATDAEYWRFSMHEMGVFDLPAMVDYALDVSGADRLHCVGYSQGCVIFFIMCSERPEYARKVALFAGFSPLLYVRNASHPWLPLVSKFERPLRFITTRLGLSRMRFGVVRRCERLLTAHSWTQTVIKTVIMLTFGTKFSKIRNASLGTLVRFLQGLNYHSLYHAMQMFNKSQFVQFDCDPRSNLKAYGSETVREYRVENATCPILLYYSDQDWFLPGENVSMLVGRLPNVIGSYRVDSEDFSHFDFLGAEEAVEKIYTPMVHTLLAFQHQK